MSVIIAFIVFIALWLLIEILAVVFKLTGLDFDKARFQIISIITHTGFTTRESELIAQHKMRRRIASWLMIISYISQVMLISLFVNILIQNKNQLVYIGIMLLVVAVMLIVFTRSRHMNTRFNKFVEKLLSKSIKRQDNTSIDSILQVSEGYGVHEIVLEENNGLCGHSLRSSQLSKLEINVLKVDRGEKVYDFPDAQFVLQQGDRLILYGKTENITEIVLDSLR